MLSSRSLFFSNAYILRLVAASWHPLFVLSRCYVKSGVGLLLWLEGPIYEVVLLVVVVVPLLASPQPATGES